MPRLSYGFRVCRGDITSLEGRLNGYNKCRFAFSLKYVLDMLNPLCANPTKWPNTLKQIADELFECV